MKCSVCDRETPDFCLENHHLIPRAKGGKEKILVCCDCADQLHNLFSIKELRDSLNTIEAIKSNVKVRTWVKWIRKKKEFGVCMKLKKKAR